MHCREIKKQRDIREPYICCKLLCFMCYKVILIILLFEIFVKEAGLNSCIILIFSLIIRISFAKNRMEIDLADLYSCIDADRLHAEHFKCPVA